MKTLIKTTAIFLLLLATHYTMAQRSVIADSLTFYNFGLPAIHQHHVKDSIANTMGFGYKYVAGCVVSPQQMEEIHAHNRAVRMRLNRWLGPNWEDELNEKYAEAMKEGE